MPGALITEIMDTTTLEIANDLNRKIKEFTSALECFEWQPTDDNGNNVGSPISLNPSLIIEYDGDGREQIKLPVTLSATMITFLKSEIVKWRATAMLDFIAM